MGLTETVKETKASLGRAFHFLELLKKFSDFLDGLIWKLAQWIAQLIISEPKHNHVASSAVTIATAYCCK